MNGESCATCVYYKTEAGYMDGKCRRRAPIAGEVPTSHGNSRWMTLFPIMLPEDWCGDWNNEPRREARRP